MFNSWMWHKLCLPLEPGRRLQVHTLHHERRGREGERGGCGQGGGAATAEVWASAGPAARKGSASVRDEICLLIGVLPGAHSPRSCGKGRYRGGGKEGGEAAGDSSKDELSMAGG